MFDELVLTLFLFPVLCQHDQFQEKQLQHKVPGTLGKVGRVDELVSEGQGH